MEITITEALAEVKTITSRLEKQRQSVIDYLYHQGRYKDPMEKDGGSHNFVKQQRQSINDLENRIVTLRRGIAKANEATPVTICGETKTIAEWLTWRRDVAPSQQKFLAQVRTKLDQVRREAAQKTVSVVQAGESKSDDDIIVNLSEKALAADIEKIDTILGTLDGQLSLKNATVTINV